MSKDVKKMKRKRIALLTKMLLKKRKKEKIAKKTEDSFEEKASVLTKYLSKPQTTYNQTPQQNPAQYSIQQYPAQQQYH